MGMTEEEAHQRFLEAVIRTGGQRRFARQHDLTPGYINDLVHKRRKLSDTILAIIGVARAVVVEYREREE